MRTTPAILIAAAVWYGVFIGRTAFNVGGEWHFTLFDDAMVSMRYAKNFADGLGLVWNPAEPPVQGYTNLLWTLWMAAVHAAGVPIAKTSLVVSVSTIPVLLATAYTAGLLARRLGGGRGAAAGAMLLTAFYYPLTFWTLRGTEVGVIALAVVAACCAAIDLITGDRSRSLLLFGASAAVGILTRFDAVVPFAVLGIVIVSTCRPERRWRLASAVTLAVAVPAMLQLAVSLSYYGHLWPNTYYLKMTGVGVATRAARGSVFVALAFIRHLFPALLVLWVSHPYWGNGRRRRAMVPMAVVLAQCAYSVYVGGDAWESYGFSNRYIAVALPALLAVTAVGAGRIGREAVARRAPLTSVVALFSLGIAAKLVVEWGLVAAGRNLDAAAVALFRLQPLVVSVVTAATALALLVLAWNSGRIVARAPWTTRRTAVAAGLTALVWVSMNGWHLAAWAALNAPETRYDNRTARAALLTRDSTDPAAVVAAARAGAFSYFAERRSVDLLGKSDPYIARLPPRWPFKPGHDRWDYPASVRRGQPDVIGDLWLPAASDFTFLAAAGYIELPNRLIVREASPHVDVRRIGAGVDE